MKAPSPNAYLQTKVMTASPAELRLMLFDGAVRFAEQARLGLENRDFEACYVGVTRCQNILLELINGLRHEIAPDLCEKLAALYTFMYTRLMSASSERNPAIVDEVLKLLRYERETWAMLLEQLTRENQSAGTMSQTPEAKPPAGAAGPTVRELIGGTVSLRG